MNTPICDFVSAYAQRQGIRLHMPGHKGAGETERMDITEIAGADELYHPRGIIRESEENAARLFGTARTVYSAEGSSLCIRGMLYLALMHAGETGEKPLILAARNVHKTFMTAAALLDLDVMWLPGDSLISCSVSAERLDQTISEMKEKPAAVYITSPDYLGHMADISSLAAVCHRHGALLLVDNAHGAYLKFLPRDRHPITQGADLCCDSAHKTLPVLTGGAYLHVGKNAPSALAARADRAMALFASTSPSYLILQSLDRCNAALAGDYPDRLAALAEQAEKIKKRLQNHGYDLVGEEIAKITLAPKTFGYTGNALHDLLRGQNMECEFSDPDFLTVMLSPALPERALEKMTAALLSIPRKAPIAQLPPPAPRPEKALSIRGALLARQEEVPADRCLGRILADAPVSCPPAVPILISGERIDEAALRCFRYYGVESCWVTAE